MFMIPFLLTLGLFAAPSDDAAVIAAQKPLYPLTTCPISGKLLDDDGMGGPIDIVHEGRLVRLCCKGCIKKFNANPEPVLAALDQAAIAAQMADYPLDTCVVSGEPLDDSMGGVIDSVQDGRLVRFCCKGCIKDFAKDKDSYLAKLDAATIAAQKADYPLTTCPVSGEPLDDDAIDVLYGTKLVRLCCNGCRKKLLANPAPVLAKLVAARAGQGALGSLGAMEHGEHDEQHEGHGSRDGHGARDGR